MDRPPADDGVRTTFQPGWTGSQRFAIDAALLRERLHQIGVTPIR